MYESFLYVRNIYGTFRFFLINFEFNTDFLTVKSLRYSEIDFTRNAFEKGGKTRDRFLSKKIKAR